MLPPPSVPHAGVFASLPGKAASEFPLSSRRCVIAPGSCLLYAGGGLKQSAHAVESVAAPLVPIVAMA
jgi:hypothetical protein